MNRNPDLIRSMVRTLERAEMNESIRDKTFGVVGHSDDEVRVHAVVLCELGLASPGGHDAPSRPSTASPSSPTPTSPSAPGRTST
jgi:hypothetical protein